MKTTRVTTKMGLHYIFRTKNAINSHRNGISSGKKNSFSKIHPSIQKISSCFVYFLHCSPLKKFTSKTNPAPKPPEQYRTMCSLKNSIQPLSNTVQLRKKKNFRPMQNEMERKNTNYQSAKENNFHNWCTPR